MKSLPSLLFFFGLLAFLTSEGFSLTTSDNPQSPNLEQIALIRDGLYKFEGFYIDASISFGNNTKYGKMVLEFINSGIIFPDDYCFGRSLAGLTCREFGEGCDPEAPTTKAIEHHYFSGVTNPRNVTLMINSTVWDHNRETLMAFNCTTATGGYYIPRSGIPRNGIIGMGTEGSSVKSPSSVFSIIIDKYWTNGTLLFSFNSSLANLTSPPVVFSADSNWQIHYKKGRLDVGYASIPITGNIIFDVNIEDIILPYDIWKIVLIELQRQEDSCTPGATSRIFCRLNKFELPPMRLDIDGTVLEIPYEVLTNYWESYSIYLTASNTTYRRLQKQVRPLFKDSIILGAQFMAHYYTVFKSNEGSNTIEIYQKNVTIPTPPTPVDPIVPDPKPEKKEVNTLKSFQN